ncbi:MAG: c-type cytochrome [Gammaproteobacteria bacterium]|nr:c-type cytochrome [Gammaproteobacteria bacterium]
MTSRLLFLMLLLSGLFSPQVHSAPDGRKLYNQYCSVCHNDQGIGGIGLPLNSSKVQYFPRDYLFKTIRLGREGRIMPAFEKLSDAQINAIVDHVLSWKKTSSTVTFNPVSVSGDAAVGKKQFIEHCADCHGEDGKSEGVGTGVSISRTRKFEVVPPALNNPGFLASASDAWIKHTIVEGRPDTSMPSQRELEISDAQVNNIVSYIRSFETDYNQKEVAELEPPTLTFESPYDFVTTVSNLKQSLQGLNYRYFPDRYMEMGLIDDNRVNKKQLSLRFCNFKQLYNMINTEPRLGVVLPCRVTVVEQDDGQVIIYAMNMKMVSRLFNNDQLSHTAEAMNEALIELIDEATL